MPPAEGERVWKALEFRLEPQPPGKLTGIRIASPADPPRR